MATDQRLLVNLLRRTGPRQVPTPAASEAGRKSNYMMYPLAVDDHAQLKFPGRQRQAAFEAVDIRGDRGPARLCGNQRFDPGPLKNSSIIRELRSPRAEYYILTTRLRPFPARVEARGS
jgi:hypothetical protein